ncbi:MAG: hypothetical protein QY312_03245 [Candidatus Dojkabacteria bacterium]|nr:MAG: hypothetical protein QY312_03245 [Candidatus Dojkabacteria bacterium]
MSEQNRFTLALTQKTGKKHLIAAKVVIEVSAPSSFPIPQDHLRSLQMYNRIASYAFKSYKIEKGYGSYLWKKADEWVKMQRLPVFIEDTNPMSSAGWTSAMIIKLHPNAQYLGKNERGNHTWIYNKK